MGIEKFEKMNSLLRFSLYLTVIILCNRNRTRSSGLVIEAGVGDKNLAAPQVSQLNSGIDGPFRLRTLSGFVNVGTYS